MKGVMKSFLLFIGGIFIVLIILSTVFGRGIAYNLLWFIAGTEPSYLQEELVTLLTEAAYSPGDFETKIRIDFERDITISDSLGYPTVLVEAPAQSSFSRTPTKPKAFLIGDCEIVKTCTKICSFIGEGCRVDSDCCSGLDCNYVTLICESGGCGDGAVNSLEECDIGPDLTPGTVDDVDTACPGQCLSNCTCPSEYIQCNDLTDNDDDGFCDLSTSTCTDGSAAGDSGCSDGNDDRECGEVAEICTSDSDCCKMFSCVSKVIFEKTGGFLFIKKFFENNQCKIKIEGMR